MKQYIGITVGPIFDTISEASKPASLWFASGIFSDFTRRLCEALRKSTLNVNLISPFFDGNDNYTGVGKYHDRIIFSSEKFERAELENIINTVKENTIDVFPKSIFEGSLDEETAKAYLRQYIQAPFIVLDESAVTEINAINAMSDYLDALELARTIPANNANSPIKKVFGGDKEKINNYIKESSLFTLIPEKDSQFRSKENKYTIRSIEEIANYAGNKDFKKNSYFAVVSADGDGVGKYLKSIVGDDATKEFSKKCIEYAEHAAGMVQEFGGMTIYAGGDDLLFLSPIEGKDGKTVLQLCSEINQYFMQVMKSEFANPTISFGVAIRYMKYPLYEALAAAREALHKVKSTDTKNAIAIDLQKHSGQSVSLLVPHEKVDTIHKLFELDPTNAGKSDDEKKNQETTEENNSSDKGNELEQKLHSVIYKLDLMAPVIAALNNTGLPKKEYQEAFVNFFDNPSEKSKEEAYIRVLSDFYFDECRQKEGRKITVYNEKSSREYYTDKKHENDTSGISCLAALLRVKKFLVEKGEEKNE